MVQLNRILLLCCALLLLAVDALAQSGGMAPPPDAWQRYRVAREEFSIALPTLPAMTTYVQTREGREPRTQRYLGVYADGVVYTIYCDDTEPQDAIKNSRKRLLPMQGASTPDYGSRYIKGRVFCQWQRREYPGQVRFAEWVNGAGHRSRKKD